MDRIRIPCAKGNHTMLGYDSSEQALISSLAGWCILVAECARAAETSRHLHIQYLLCTHLASPSLSGVQDYESMRAFCHPGLRGNSRSESRGQKEAVYLLPILSTAGENEQMRSCSYLLGNKGVHALNGNTTERRAVGTVEVPTLEDLGGIKLIPTQALAVMKAAARGRGFNLFGYPAERVDVAAIMLGADGALSIPTTLDMRLHTHRGDAVPTRVAFSTRVLWRQATRDQVTVYRGPKAETQKYSGIHESVMPLARSGFENKEMKQVLAAMGSARRAEPLVVGMPGNVHGPAANALYGLYQTTARGTCYIRWFTCAFLTYFTMVTRERMTALHAAAVHAEDAIAAYNFPAVHHISLGAAAAAVVAVAGVAPVVGLLAKETEDTIWDAGNMAAVHDGTRFFIDSSEAVDHAYLAMIARFAGDYPVCRHRTTPVPGGQEYKYLTEKYNIAGATHVYIHTGAYEQRFPTAVYAADNNPSSITILNTITRFMIDTCSYEDARVAFELASGMGFGTGHNTLGNLAQGYQVIAALADRPTAFGGIWAEGSMYIPRDITLAEYFRPFMLRAQDTTGMGQFLTSTATRIYMTASLYSHSLNVAMMGACKALSITGECMRAVRAADRGNNPEQVAAHLQLLTHRTDQYDISDFGRCVQNVCAHIFGWEPNPAVLVYYNFYEDQVSHANRLRGKFNYIHPTWTPGFVNIYEQLWLVRMLPDFMAFPTTKSVIKWPDQKEGQMVDAWHLPQDIRLGAALYLGQTYLWVGDGGADYSAQFYISNNGAAGPGALVETYDIKWWQHPDQRALPAAPQNANWARLPAPFENFMRPGTLNSWAHRERRTRAYGLQLTVGAAHAITTRQIMAKEPFNSPVVVMMPADAAKVETEAHLTYRITALEDGSGRGLGFNLQPADRVPEPFVGSRVDQRSSPTGGIMGPAAAPNDNRPDSEPTQEASLGLPEGKGLSSLVGIKNGKNSSNPFKSSSGVLTKPVVSAPQQSVTAESRQFSKYWQAVAAPPSMPATATSLYRTDNRTNAVDYSDVNPYAALDQPADETEGYTEEDEVEYGLAQDNKQTVIASQSGYAAGPPPSTTADTLTRAEFDQVMREHYAALAQLVQRSAHVPQGTYHSPAYHQGHTAAYAGQGYYIPHPAVPFYGQMQQHQGYTPQSGPKLYTPIPAPSDASASQASNAAQTPNTPQHHNRQRQGPPAPNHSNQGYPRHNQQYRRQGTGGQHNHGQHQNQQHNRGGHGRNNQRFVPKGSQGQSVKQQSQGSSGPPAAHASGQPHTGHSAPTAPTARERELKHTHGPDGGGGNEETPEMIDFGSQQNGVGHRGGSMNTRIDTSMLPIHRGADFRSGIA